jgi:hypothetical protein
MREFWLSPVERKQYCRERGHQWKAAWWKGLWEGRWKVRVKQHRLCRWGSQLKKKKKKENTKGKERQSEPQCGNPVRWGRRGYCPKEARKRESKPRPWEVSVQGEMRCCLRILHLYVGFCSDPCPTPYPWTSKCHQTLMAPSYGKRSTRVLSLFCSLKRQG